MRSLHDEAQLSQVGRIAAHFNMVDNLSIRLRLVDARKRRPEIAGQVISRPLFILGLPRTGTTILYELIAQDPAFRAPLSWEVASPCPPPAADTYRSDARIASTQRMLTLLESLAPGFRAIHAIGSQLPQECVYMLASQFYSEQFSYMYNVPAYRAWLLQQDMTPAYQWHRAFLQHLQVDMPTQQWVLKTPAHLGVLPTLLQQYPDARLVWTHRQPLDAIASFASLATNLRSGFSDAVDPMQVGAQEMSHSYAVTQRAVEARSGIDSQQLLDVSFDEICGDPMAVVMQIYAHFGLTLTAEANDNMRRYLQQRPRYLYGEHRYAPTDYGLSEARVREQFGAYRERFARWL